MGDGKEVQLVDGAPRAGDSEHDAAGHIALINRQVQENRKSGNVWVPAVHRRMIAGSSWSCAIGRRVGTNRTGGAQMRISRIGCYFSNNVSQATMNA